jgi:hypothetical protein
MGNGSLAYRLHETWRGLYPAVSIGVASHARFAAFAVGHDFDLTSRLRISLSSGPGLYERGKLAPDLGSRLQFLSSIELSTRLRRGRRFAVALAHMSNANLGQANPGTELLQFYYLIPIHSSAPDGPQF